MAFETITTQEQLDAIIQERVGRAKDSVRKEFEGWISPEDQEKKTLGLNQQISDLNGQVKDLNEKVENHAQEIAERDTRIKAYETSSVKMRIAHETGIPYEMANRLSGETEEDIRKDAAMLARFITKGKYTGPLKGDGPDGESAERASMRQMLQNLKGVK